MHAVFCEGPYFLQDLKICCLSLEAAEKALVGLQTALMVDPEMGCVIPGAGGCRKARWGARGHGRSGGFRFIYLHVPRHARFLLLAAYAKGEQGDLSAEERRMMATWAMHYKLQLDAQGQKGH